MLAALLLLLLPGRAPAAESDHEKLFVVGWGDGCSVAVDHRGYVSAVGATAEEPVSTEILTLTIAPGESQIKEGWKLSLHGPFSWHPNEVAKARKNLKAEGYVQPGFVEELGKAPVSTERDLPRLLMTTDTLKAVASKPYPGPGWTWTRVYYEPVSSCALLYYERKDGDRSFYDYRLVKVASPSARADRALAHLTNGLIAMGLGNLQGALAETEVAARIAPDMPMARYHHAALMSLSGVVEPAVDELEGAVALDPTLKKRARKDKDFEPLRWHPRFQELTK